MLSKVYEKQIHSYEVSFKYSVCTTAFRSAALVDDFVRPFLELGKETQIVVVDNESKDGTCDLLNKYGGQVKAISMRCSRGIGRQKAMEMSDGNIIINVEFDVEYSGIIHALEHYDRADKGKIYYYIINGQKCNASLYIGERELFNKVGGFPNLNYAEDLYMNKNAEKMGLFETVYIEMDIRCLEVAGLSSGAEARYERNKIKQVIRRIVATRDILFVNQIGYNELMQKYKLSGIRAIFVGLPEYILGKLLQFTIRVAKLDQ